ncbi:MAG: tRNA (N(6)-L-threonylcarbamoyladenosine(37)-C(2))-methylthiotransferase MtaB [Eubacteriales bacterium]|nr:tRNA (N(6)-L-threonylcarbamoyladenosine(37)-C(2))-methylthiotransferase MtaB [Eubacteriales bacterium]
MVTKKRAAFHTLGCKVNQYETEALIEQFRRAGFEIVGEDQTADAYIINTCTVTNLADRKSRQFIRRARKKNSEAVIAVTGCYAQVKPEEISSIEGVEIVCGTDEKKELLHLVEERLVEKDKEDLENIPDVKVLPHDELTQYEELGHIRGMGSRSRAFIKIQDGCDNYCTYCLIPYARGRIRSRAEKDIIEEVQRLTDAGFAEIVLTGINTAYYGRENASAGGGLEPLLAKLNDLSGDFRIRLSSLEPTMIDAAYVKRLLPFDRLCHHLHLALQSGSDRVLTEMHRRYTMKEYREILDVLRDFDPEYGVSTDIIVGFPGETERDFQESVKIVREARFCKTHVFPYSPREGTAASLRTDQIPGTVKHERSKILLEEADQAEQDFLRSCTGSFRDVLIEKTPEDPVTGEDQGIFEDEKMTAEKDGEKAFSEGYTDNYIKTLIYGSAETGTIRKVRLNGVMDGGMRGELV